MRFEIERIYFTLEECKGNTADQLKQVMQKCIKKLICTTKSAKSTILKEDIFWKT